MFVSRAILYVENFNVILKVSIHTFDIEVSHYRRGSVPEKLQLAKLRLPYGKLAVRRTAILILGKSEEGRKALKLAL
jgi:hypothetical protein